MNCPRYGEECNEFMCGSSINGICTERSGMRNPKRIDEFTKELNRIWKRYFPDWNFYELFSKFFQRFNRMNFYICEDDRILLLLKVFYYENNFDEKYEIWKDIKNYEGYYMISNYGRVKSLDRYVKTKNNSVKLHKGKILKEF